MIQRISKGYAVGLSNHSSMQGSSEMFKKSEVFEVSSISKKYDEDYSEKEEFEVVSKELKCRFCQKNAEFERLFRVCKCEIKFSAHKSCLNAQRKKKCKNCESK